MKIIRLFLFVLMCLLSTSPVFAQQTDQAYVEIVFDISGSMNELILQESQESSFLDEFKAFAQSNIDLETSFDLPEIEIPEITFPELEVLDDDQVSPLERGVYSDVDPIDLPEVEQGIIQDLQDVDQLYVDAQEIAGFASKISIARDALQQTLEKVPDGTQVAFRVFGVECGYSEQLVDFGVENHQQIVELASQIQPDGGTPLVYAISKAREDLLSKDGLRKMVIITDGNETCGGGLIEEAENLKESNIQADLIYFGDAAGFEVDLIRFTEVAEGRYISVNSGEQLESALSDSFTFSISYQSCWLIFVLLVILLVMGFFLYKNHFLKWLFFLFYSLLVLISIVLVSFFCALLGWKVVCVLVLLLVLFCIASRKHEKK